MIRIICILIVVHLSFFVTAQEESHEHESKKELNFFGDIGINGTHLISQFLKSDNLDSIQSPYLLTFKFGLNGHAIRAGAGMTYRKSVERVGGFLDSRTRKISTNDFRIGYEYQWDLSDRWRSNFGADFVYASTLNQIIDDSGFDLVTTQTEKSGFGGGPIIGLQYRVKNRLWIGTEGAFYWMLSEEDSSRTFSNFPIQNSDPINIDHTEMVILFPATVYLIFHFGK